MSAKVKDKNCPVGTGHVYRSDAPIRCFVAGNAAMEQSLDKVVCILRREHYKGKACPFTGEMALDLDKVELLSKKGKKGTVMDKTVDFAVCLDDDWLLLVEAKLDVDNAVNISKDEICGKIRHSQDILMSCCNFKHFEKKVVVLLKEKNYQQNYNRLRRSLMPRNPNVAPLTVKKFYSDYFVL